MCELRKWIVALRTGGFSLHHDVNGICGNSSDGEEQRDIRSRRYARWDLNVDLVFADGAWRKPGKEHSRRYSADGHDGRRNGFGQCGAGSRASAGGRVGY